MKCSFHCEMCEKFFKCKSPEKLKIFERRRMALVLKGMSQIDHKVAICAGKGGVGKSLFTVNFSAVLAQRGQKVAVPLKNLDTFGKLGARVKIAKTDEGLKNAVPLRVVTDMGEKRGALFIQLIEEIDISEVGSIETGGKREMS